MKTASDRSSDSRSNEACDSVRLAYRSVFIIMTLSDTAIRPSVCPSVCPSPWRATAVNYRYAGCLQLSHVRTANPSADGRRSAASRTAIGGGGISSRRPRGDNLFQEHVAALLNQSPLKHTVQNFRRSLRDRVPIRPQPSRTPDSSRATTIHSLAYSGQPIASTTISHVQCQSCSVVMSMAYIHT